MGLHLEVQGLGLSSSSAGGTGSVPGQGTKIPQAMLHGRNKNKEMAKKLGNNDTVLGHHLLSWETEVKRGNNHSGQPGYSRVHTRAQTSCCSQWQQGSTGSPHHA